jgi:glycosyl transferase family 25
MKVFLINLDRNPERLVHMGAVLQKAAIPFERIAAVDGRLLSQRDLAKAGANLSAGEVGCVLSHRIAWRQIAEASDPYGVVLEDDFHASPVMGEFCCSTAWIPADADIVTLEAGRKPVALARQPAASHVNRRIRRMLSTHSGAAAYVVSRAAAQILLDRSEHPMGAPDAIAFDPPRPGGAPLTVYQVEPALCIQDAFLPHDQQTAALGSNLQDDRQKTRRRQATLVSTIVREVKYPLSKVARAARSALGGEQWVAVPFVE